MSGNVWQLDNESPIISHVVRDLRKWTASLHSSFFSGAGGGKKPGTIHPGLGCLLFRPHDEDKLLNGWCPGFHKWGYPNSWMVYDQKIILNNLEMDVTLGGPPIYASRIQLDRPQTRHGSPETTWVTRTRLSWGLVGAMASRGAMEINGMGMVAITWVIQRNVDLLKDDLPGYHWSKLWYSKMLYSKKRPTSQPISS